MNPQFKIEFQIGDQFVGYTAPKVKGSNLHVQAFSLVRVCQLIREDIGSLKSAWHVCKTAESLQYAEYEAGEIFGILADYVRVTRLD